MATTFEVKGLKETLAVFEQLRIDIGNKEATSKVLVPAVKEAMKPVLSMAKSLSPKDTGLLERSLTLIGRKPTASDRKSRYIQIKDDAIAIVGSRAIPKKIKKAFYGQEHIKSYLNELGRYKKGSLDRASIYKKIGKEKRGFFESKNSFYDARVISNEFGTVNRAAKPFLRISLESQAQEVTAALGQILKQKIEQYRSKSL